ncbi:MAG TPA: hypothetical protein VN737_01320 [Bryobacteraceae bacterium]|nr:hypothetical protein [Bryobacteraceae bacterium]
MIESAFRLRASTVLAAAVVLFSCGHRNPSRPRAAYVPLAQLESLYGRLITAGNHPTPDQHGTGDRVGLFLDASGTIWGLPLAVEKGGEVLGCGPSELRNARVTDTYPSGATILGATNEPTGWRGGTGKLELLLRRSDGEIRWTALSGGQTFEGPVCWAQELPGPPQSLQYYRVAPSTERN